MLGVRPEEGAWKKGEGRGLVGKGRDVEYHQESVLGLFWGGEGEGVKGLKESVP